MHCTLNELFNRLPIPAPILLSLCSDHYFAISLVSTSVFQPMSSKILSHMHRLSLGTVCGVSVCALRDALIFQCALFRNRAACEEHDKYL